mgnify:FL=1|jgi:ribonuclease P protein component|tara:strand:- start:3299 stop:3739 length:441 start_codon:yes stop_codon:yes gene_type:complete
MALGQEWLLKVVKNLLPEDGLKVEKLSQLKMVKLESLKKSNHFKTTLKERKTHTDFFSIFAAKNTINPKTKNLIISFVMKKKIGNAVKRNKIRRKLKAIVQKLLKIKGAINKNYTYIVFGKTRSFSEKHEKLLEVMTKSFKKIDNK